MGNFILGGAIGWGVCKFLDFTLASSVSAQPRAGSAFAQASAQGNPGSLFNGPPPGGEDPPPPIGCQPGVRSHNFRF